MSTRNKQVFVLPSSPLAPLAAPPSPWHRGSRVTLPFEHWSVVLRFARTRDVARAERLRAWSSIGDRPDPSLSPSADALRDMAAFLRELALAIAEAPPLVPEPTEEFPEDFVNEEHARMVQAVAALLQAAADRDEPLCAWVD